MEWEGEWIDESAIGEEWHPDSWPYQLKPWQDFVRLFRRKHSQNGIVRCRFCDYAMGCPTSMGNSDWEALGDWIATHAWNHFRAYDFSIDEQGRPHKRTRR